MVLPVQTNTSLSSPPFSWRLWYLNLKPSLFPDISSSPSPSQFKSFPVLRHLQQMCLLLCPVNSVWPWEQFLTQLAARVLFSLNFGSRLNWIFRQHPGEHSWESTSIHLEDAYSIASQPAFQGGTPSSHVSAKTPTLSPLHCLFSDQYHLQLPPQIL